MSKSQMDGRNQKYFQHPVQGKMLSFSFMECHNHLKDCWNNKINNHPVMFGYFTFTPLRPDAVSDAVSVRWMYSGHKLFFFPCFTIYRKIKHDAYSLVHRMSTDQHGRQSLIPRHFSFVRIILNCQFQPSAIIPSYLNACGYYYMQRFRWMEDSKHTAISQKLLSWPEWRQSAVACMWKSSKNCVCALNVYSNTRHLTVCTAHAHGAFVT